MAYVVSLKRSAEKELDRLPTKTPDRIVERLISLKEDPCPTDVKKLHGREGYRIRVGDYRILYVIFVNPKMAGHLLPWTHKFIANVKAILRGPHRGLSTKHLQRYLSEACYRFNRRYWSHQLFNRLLFACTLGKPIIREKLLAPSMAMDSELCQ